MNLKSVCLLLSLFHASSAIGLGLGELSVRSHLGQALHVSVKIWGQMQQPLRAVSALRRQRALLFRRRGRNSVWRRATTKRSCISAPHTL
ncbi:MAG: hypothetical protein ACYCZT_03505 [Thiobacillus sp.]